jgi:hypothetical protein
LAKPEEKMPIYNDRVNEVLRGLTEGKTREELATGFGQSSWKSLDIYMRRKNFAWDGRLQNYVPVTTRADELRENLGSTAPPKVSLVISLFKQESPDPRAIARQVGFKDHRELAEFMMRKGYVWSPEEGNYVENTGEINNESGIGAVSEQNSDVTDSGTGNVVSFPTGKRTLLEDGSELERFLPLMEIINKNKERLLDLLVPGSGSGTLPRYAIPGTTRTKGIYMSDFLARLLGEFSESKNVSQREIVEGALVEYLRRYGFAREVEVMLKRV